MAKKKKKTPKKLTKKQKKFIKNNSTFFIILAIVVLIVIIVVAFFYRDKIQERLFPKPKVPTTKSVSGIEINNEGILSWKSVGNDAKYTIELKNEEPIETNETSFDLTQYKDKIKDGLLIDIYAKQPNLERSFKRSITIHFDSDSNIYTFEYNYTYAGYYAGIDYKMSDVEIFNKLYEKISVVTAGNGSQNSSYGEVRDILVESDINQNEKTVLWGIYDNAEIPADWGNGNVFQREHVWPNSRLGIPRVNNNSRDQGSDPHNLRAIIGSTNSSRSNRYFVAGSGEAGYTIGTDQYYPGDAHRGDVARILLYMAVRYKDILSLVETPGGNTYEPSGAQMGQLSLLLDWHLEDPVDDFEIYRNDIIYKHQGNRNPFIDHPELFERVYDHIVLISVNSKKPITVLDIVIKNMEIQSNSYFINNTTKEYLRYI